jgi:hypothetical protein
MNIETTLAANIKINDEVLMVHNGLIISTPVINVYHINDDSESSVNIVTAHNEERVVHPVSPDNHVARIIG